MSEKALIFRAQRTKKRRDTCTHLKACMCESV
jgi:hypothetical protein